jgi:hypothetical protein
MYYIVYKGKRLLDTWQQTKVSLASSQMHHRHCRYLQLDMYFTLCQLGPLATRRHYCTIDLEKHIGCLSAAFQHVLWS